jgi:integrase
VKFTRAKGKLYAYFNTGRRKPNGAILWSALPPFGSAKFYESYAAHLGARTKFVQGAPAIPTISSVSRLYQQSDDWKRKAEGTKKLYSITLAKVEAEFGDFPLEDVTRRRLLDVLDEVPGAATRNMFVALVGVLFKFARYRELTTANPAKDIPKFDMGEHEPWPDDLLTAALASDDDRVRLAVHLLYYTGQRIGDVVRLRWSDIRNGLIVVTPSKTKRFKKTLHIYQHSALEAELARTPKRGLTILAQANGKPYHQETIRGALKDFAGEVSVVPHGLRKNAVTALIEAGCTPHEVQSVTGQSLEMIEHYAKRLNMGRVSEAAILKLEKRNR